MVICSSNDLDRTFHALSDPTRRAILSRLVDGEANAGELGSPFNISQPAVSKHLRVLQSAGLVTSQKDGRHQRFCLVAGPMRDALQWLVRYRAFWEGQLDALGQFLGELKERENET